MHYLVTQTPKRKYRGGLHTVAMIVDAKNGAEAIRLAVQHGNTGSENWFGPSPEYSNPKAEPLPLNRVIGF